jgi:altronate hydrolase
MGMKDILIINDSDNVAIALRNIEKGEKILVHETEIEVKEPVNRGHKISLTDISEGEHIVKYGFPIGHTTTKVSSGEFVHTHNTKTNLNRIQEYKYEQRLNSNPFEKKI